MEIQVDLFTVGGVPAQNIARNGVYGEAQITPERDSAQSMARGSNAGGVYPSVCPLDSSLFRLVEIAAGGGLHGKRWEKAKRRIRSLTATKFGLVNRTKNRFSERSDRQTPKGDAA